MEKSGKRGKIPQSDWPLIMARYEQGETLSSIARTYDCSPPAISYIVSRNKEKAAAEAPPLPAAEATLVKSYGHIAAEDHSVVVEPLVVSAPPITLVRGESAPEARPVAVSADTAGANAEPRRKLHLSLGNGNAGAKPNGNGGTASDDGKGHAAETDALSSVATPRLAEPALNGNGQRPMQAPRNPPPFDAGRNGRDLFAMPEGRPSAQQPRDAEPSRKDGAFIDQELRERVDGDIAAFLTAFDAALAEDTQESRFGLREATDRLLRAGARTRIELERLEARVPLSVRDGVAERQPAAWRYR
jgi:hypothetical protein